MYTSNTGHHIVTLTSITGQKSESGRLKTEVSRYEAAPNIYAVYVHKFLKSWENTESLIIIVDWKTNKFTVLNVIHDIYKTYQTQLTILANVYDLYCTTYNFWNTVLLV